MVTALFPFRSIWSRSCSCLCSSCFHFVDLVFYDFEPVYTWPQIDGELFEYVSRRGPIYCTVFLHYFRKVHRGGLLIRMSFWFRLGFQGFSFQGLIQFLSSVCVWVKRLCRRKISRLYFAFHWELHWFSTFTQGAIGSLHGCRQRRSMQLTTPSSGQLLT